MQRPDGKTLGKIRHKPEHIARHEPDGNRPDYGNVKKLFLENVADGIVLGDFKIINAGVSQQHPLNRVVLVPDISGKHVF